MINEKIVNKLAGKYRWSGIAFEDLQAEGLKLAVEAMQKYDPAGGASPSSWQWICIDNGLKDLLRKELQWKNNQKRPHQEDVEKYDRCSINYLDTFTANDDPIQAFEHVSGFSAEAKMVCSAIFNAPAEYMSLMPKIARGALIKKFRGEGWSWPTIWRVFNEIKTALN